MQKKLIFIFSLLLLFALPGQAQTEEELWKKFYHDPSEENVKQFIAGFPASQLMPQVAERIWGVCRADLDKKSCEMYIRFFPSGEHVAEAGEIRSRASDAEMIVDGVTDVVEDIIQIFDQDDNEPLQENEIREEPENQLGLEPGETVSSIASSQDRSSGQKQPAKRPVVKPDARPPATKPVANPRVQIINISAEHNRMVNKRKGMFIHLNFKVDGLAGAPCAASVYFLDATGQPIPDLNGKFKSKKGNVVSIRKFKPTANAVRYGDFKVFMPYEELHKKGKHKILYYAVIRSSKGILDKTKPKSFTLTWRP